MENQIMRYENLIRIAFNCGSGMIHGAHKSLMRNAIWEEQGQSFVKGVNLLEDVKQHISQALLKLAKTKPYSLSSLFFTELEGMLPNADDTSQLMFIVEHALDEVVKLRDNIN